MHYWNHCRALDIIQSKSVKVIRVMQSLWALTYTICSCMVSNSTKLYLNHHHHHHQLSYRTFLQLIQQRHSLSFTPPLQITLQILQQDIRCPNLFPDTRRIPRISNVAILEGKIE